MTAPSPEGSQSHEGLSSFQAMRLQESSTFLRKCLDTLDEIQKAGTGGSAKGPLMALQRLKELEEAATVTIPAHALPARSRTPRNRRMEEVHCNCPLSPSQPPLLSHAFPLC